MLRSACLEYIPGKFSDSLKIRLLAGGDGNGGSEGSDGSWTRG